jgi:hypothetical protein
LVKIDNKSKYHDKQIKEIIDFVMPKLVKVCYDRRFFNLTVRVRTGNGATGHAAGHGKNWEVFIQVPSHLSKYPFQEVKGGSSMTDRIGTRKAMMAAHGTFDYVPAFIQTRDEHIVHIAAHELYHVAQDLGRFFEKKSKDDPTNYSDGGADRFAIRKQRAWRKLHNNPVYAIPLWATSPTPKEPESKI